MITNFNTFLIELLTMLQDILNFFNNNQNETNVVIIHYNFLLVQVNIKVQKHSLSMAGIESPIALLSCVTKSKKTFKISSIGFSGKLSWKFETPSWNLKKKPNKFLQTNLSQSHSGTVEFSGKLSWNYTNPFWNFKNHTVSQAQERK